MAIREFRYVNFTGQPLRLDDSTVVDPGGFTGPIDDTLPVAAAQIAAGNLMAVPNGTFATVYGSGTDKAPSQHSSGPDMSDVTVSKVLTTSGPGTAINPDPVATQGTGELVVAVIPGMSTVSIRKYAGSGTIVFESSLSNGANWDSLVCCRADATGSQATTSGVTTGYETWEAAIPAGTTHIRARCSVVAGSVSVRLSQSQSQYEPAITASLSGAVSIAASQLIAVQGLNSGGDSISAKRGGVDGSGSVVKGSAGTIYGYDFANTSAAWRYVKLFNKATAPVLGTDTPLVTIAVPPGGRSEHAPTTGMKFSVGIAIAITQSPSDTDTVVSLANEVIGHVHYV